MVYCPEATGGTASNFIEVCKVREQYDSHYVFYLLYTLYQHGLVMKYQQQTTGIINFKLNDYKNEVIAIPETKAAQKRLAGYLVTLDELIDQTQTLIIKHERLREGMLRDLLARGVDDARERQRLLELGIERRIGLALQRLKIHYRVVGRRIAKGCDILNRYRHKRSQRLR